MARDAINRRMRSDQREAIFVRAHRLKRDIPADHTVTLLAIRAKLPAVNVCVAVCALRAYVAEYRFGVALNAIHLCVHASQGVARFIVVEFWNRADRLPTGLRMAILTRNRKRTVRAARL